MMAEISFEHFDPELELGNLDENGRPIRPRKKPGRKPKPPSPAQRKAQNRAAQRAFRERKRREMREAEATVKRSVHIRDQAIKECKALRRKVKELQFENNYLKGYVLTLKLACNANAVDVPSFWEMGDRDDVGSENLIFSKSKDVPQTLEFFLDSNMHIIGADDNNSLPTDIANLAAAAAAAAANNHPSNANATTTTSPAATTATATTTASPHMTTAIPTTAPTPTSTTSAHNTATPTSTPTSSTISATPGSHMLEDIVSPAYSHRSATSTESITEGAMPHMHGAPIMTPMNPPQPSDMLSPPHMPSANFGGQMEPAFFHHLMHTDFGMGDLDQSRRDFVMDYANALNTASESWRAPMNNEFMGNSAAVQSVKQEPAPQVAYGSYVMPGSWSNPIIMPAESTEMPVQASASPEPRQEKRKIYPPMTPVEFVRQMRYMRSEKGVGAAGVFTPTELQRRIPHDLRIDIVPGASMRDHMILFQDYYDANELFNFLINTAMFLGGSPGNADCWFVPPAFFQKYWFLCPNHKPLDRLDNAIDVVVYMGQKMKDKMVNRKQMYIEREKYFAQFPAIADPSLELGLNDDSDREENEETMLERIDDDVPIEVMMTVMQAMPRLTSPSSFPF